jgi:hypothetical protein
MSDQLAAEPTTPLEDPRLRFFLEHREQIREWAAIADEVADAVADVLRGLSPDIVARVSGDEDLRVGERLAGEPQQNTVLYRPTWVAAPLHEPFVGVALGWDGKKVDPTGGWPGTQLPYVGISTSHFADEGKRADAALRAWFRQPGISLPGYLNGSYWIAYRPIQAPTDWWKDVAAWREWVIDQLLAAWGECAPAIGAALAADH